MTLAEEAARHGVQSADAEIRTIAVGTREPEIDDALCGLHGARATETLLQSLLVARGETR